MKYCHIFLKQAPILAFLIIFIFSFNANSQENIEIIKLGKWNEDSLSKMVNKKPSTTEAQIEFLSGKFLGTPYVASTLTGDIQTPEIFTVNLQGMDCFTYIDYVEALRLSATYEDFNTNLKDIRYQNGRVSFQNRNHFFSDWPAENSENIMDVTYQVGGSEAVVVKKSLNLKSDGSTFLPGISVVQREFYYIPSSAIDDEILARLHTGDYVGMYTEIDGLDVTHTGIVIKKHDGVYLRHASSKENNQKVIDEDFKEYVEDVPGIVVYRAK